MTPLNTQTDSPSTTHAQLRLTKGRMLLVTLVLAAGGGLWLLADTRAGGEDTLSDLDTNEWYTAAVQSFDLSITASGELDAKEQIKVKSLVSGKSTTIIELIPEGSTVAEGDVLARLDDAAISDEIETARLDLERAISDREFAERDLEIAVSDAKSKSKAADVKLRLAELDLAKWRNGDAPQKRQRLKLSLEKAERTLTRAERDLALSEQLYEEKFISLNELESSQITLIEAREGLASAKLDIEVYEKYAAVKDEQKALSDVEQAKAEYVKVTRQNENKLAQSENLLKSRRRTELIRQRKLEELETDLANTVIHAPQPGLVVYATSVGSRWRTGEPMAEGRNVRRDETIILLPDTHKMVATVLVHEALLPQVSLGQTADVIIDARPGEVVPGVVAEIAVTAESGHWSNPHLREYRVMVDLPAGYDSTLKPAMRCTATIKVGEVKDAVAIPAQAVFAEGDTHYCYVPAARGKVRRHGVTIGEASENLVAIAEGLRAGDRVLLRSPLPGEIED